MKNKIIIVLMLGITLSSCDDWLTQQDTTVLSATQAYSSVSSISSVCANLYSRLRYEQDFANDGESYDLTSWDEASNNSDYWAFPNNKNQDYRNYYDYGLIRDINQHIYCLQNYVGTDVTTVNQKYFIAEARYLRAYVYFTLVARMGGVPIIEDVSQYLQDPLELAKPRNKESEVYDYIANELDSVKTDLALANNKVTTRASKGSALALKCRAMLYAGTLAYNTDKSATKGLILPSGATGIDKNMANEYLQKCLDAYSELQDMNIYSLYQKNSNLSTNYAQVFQSETNNPEVIFCKNYDGKNKTNYFTTRAICRTLHSALKTGAQINPVLNLVNSYEDIATRSIIPIIPYSDLDHIESMGTTSSTYKYKIYENPIDIFAGRDPRLQGTIITPGASFRGVPLNFQAGLALKTLTGYTFKTAPTMENITDPTLGYYNGIQITGDEGPHQISTYVSHTGFLMRKFVDTNSGSEASGASTVPYIVFRYGEVLLNASEAAFYLNQNGVSTYNSQSTQTIALNCINQIRSRAGGSVFNINIAELTLDRIMNERKVELAYEDHRYNDLKRWRIADEVWAYDRANQNAIMYGLWPYKIFAPGDPTDGKWIYRKVKVEHRGSSSDKGQPINFDLKMYYATYPMTKGNPYIEKNPNH
jgi:starch-binding outer membrane protein, SusD/RagB family